MTMAGYFAGIEDVEEWSQVYSSANAEITVEDEANEAWHPAIPSAQLLAKASVTYRSSRLPTVISRVPRGVAQVTSTAFPTGQSSASGTENVFLGPNNSSTATADSAEPLLGLRGAALAKDFRESLAANPEWLLRKALYSAAAAMIAGVYLGALGSPLAVFFAAAVLIIWGSANFFAYSLTGNWSFDPRLALVLTVIGLGTIFVAISSLLT